MSDQADWGYSSSNGPEKWGELSEDYRPCSEGQAQSPINLETDTVIPGDFPPIEFTYRETALRIYNNGNTIRVDCDPSSSIIFDDKQYHLKQFHFHHPSEHTIDDVAADMEAHFVHETEDGDRLCIGIMLYAGAEPHEGYVNIFNNLPSKVTSEPEQAGITINLSDLLPPEGDFYAYTGSLTTPPCTENVQWVIMKRGLLVSEENINKFAALFANNARPVQPMNERTLSFTEDSLAWT